MILLRAKPNSWDVRRHSPRGLSAAGGGSTDVESVTGRICREIDETRTKLGHVISPTAMTQDTPPGLEGVPVSCYSGSFRTWPSDNNLMAEFEDEIEEPEYDDEFVDEECNVEGTPKTEHFNIDASPDRNNSTHSNFDARSPRSASRPKRPCREMSPT